MRNGSYEIRCDNVSVNMFVWFVCVCGGGCVCLSQGLFSRWIHVFSGRSAADVLRCVQVFSTAEMFRCVYQQVCLGVLSSRCVQVYLCVLRCIQQQVCSGVFVCLEIRSAAGVFRCIRVC